MSARQRSVSFRSTPQTSARASFASDAAPNEILACLGADVFLRRADRPRLAVQTETNRQ